MNTKWTRSRRRSLCAVAFTAALFPVLPWSGGAVGHATEQRAAVFCGREVAAGTVETDQGIPESNQEKFHQVSAERVFVFDVRPTNPDAVPLLKAGALPKPEHIKAKTINHRDVLLGAAEGITDLDVGKVGFFVPVLPEGADQGLRDRYDRRLEEHHELAETMARYQDEGRLLVTGGVVYGWDMNGVPQPYTGDHDVFDITRTDSERVADFEEADVIGHMKKLDMAVMHGAHMFWNPLTAFDAGIKERITAQHQGPDGEALVRFVPGQDAARLVFAQDPVSVEPPERCPAAPPAPAAPEEEDGPGAA